MKRLVPWFAACILTVATLSATAAGLKPFDENSMTALKKEQAGRPFVVVLWSASCVPCREELRLWSEWQKKYPAIKVTLVSIDPPEEHAAAQRMADRYATADADVCVFTGDYVERLRWSIDPAWYGEVPRTYFFDAAHRAKAKSGLVEAALVERWLDKNAPAAKGNR